ncbi:MAG: 3-hydroxyisobutyrate dehydrogenase [Pseudomonadota bacterium]
MDIGFIGLGNMGAPMARNLAAAGYAVTGFDVAGITVEGVASAKDAATAAGGRDLVITMLPDGAILRAVADQILPAMRAGATVADCSTVDVESARAVADRARAAGIGFVDAPVSGGIGGAEAGTLTFMAGGSAAAFDAAAPAFQVMGQKTVHCGDAGAGQAAKICNNMILGISMIGVCEAFAMAGKLGLEAERLFDVVSTSSGSCWSVNTYCPVPGIGPKSPADNDYRPGFAAELMLKDLRLAQAAARETGARTELGTFAMQIYEEFVEKGGKGKDFSSLYPYFHGNGRES